MPMEMWPRTMKAGRFKGRTFASRAEYDAAKNASPTTADAGPPSRAPSSAGKPKLLYSKAMVEAVVHLIGGALSFTPLFRADNALTEEEYKWLIDDWYAFGKRHPFFARLIVQVFSVDLYGQLALDHIIIVGARLIATKRLPEQAAFPLQMAYIVRQTMAGELNVSVESESEPVDLGVASGGSPGVGGSNEYREDIFGPENLEYPPAHDHVLHETR